MAQRQIKQDALATRDRLLQRRRAEISSDFIGGFGEWASTTAGTGAANSVTAITSTSIFSNVVVPGIVQHTTGATATGKAALMSSPTAFRFADLIGGGSVVSIAYFRAIFHLPLVSDATESFIYRLGFIDNDSTESTDGCFMRINANATAQFVCRSNNVETVVTIANTPASGSLYNIEIVVSSSTVAKLTIFDGPLNSSSGGGNGTSYTLTTNIPAFQSRLTGAGSYLQKTVGLTARTINLDFMYAGMDT